MTADRERRCYVETRCGTSTTHGVVGVGMQADPLESARWPTARSTGFAHDALFYRTDEEFVAALVPFLIEGLDTGDAAVAAVTRPNLALLREALGTDAAAVTLIDRDEWYRRPGSTVAGWRRILTDATGRGHRYVRIIGEVAFGPDDRHATWTRYESALNAVFGEAPAWIVCPYDTRVLPRVVLADARRTHPMITDTTARDAARRPSPRYVEPEQFLRELPEPVPSAAGPPVLVLTSFTSVTELRHRVEQVITAGGWLDRDRLDDLLIVLTEVASNGLRYGSGRREVRLWATDRGVVGEVRDGGPGPADPLVGYRPPGPTSDGGRGLWIVQQLCDGLAIQRDTRGTSAWFTVHSR